MYSCCRRTEGAAAGASADGKATSSADTRKPGASPLDQKNAARPAAASDSVMTRGTMPLWRRQKRATGIDASWLCIPSRIPGLSHTISIELTREAPGRTFARGRLLR